MRTALPLCLWVLATRCLFAVIPAAPAPVVGKAQAPNSDFRAIIGATLQYAHNDIWNHTPSSTGPLLPTTGEIVRGQRLDLVVSFGGFAVDPNGQGDVVYDLAITRPDGATRVIGSNLTAFHGVVPALHMMHVAAESAKLVFAREDPAGTYRFMATLKDRIGPAEVKIAGEVSLLDHVTEQPLPQDFDLKSMEAWLTHYYEHPEPRAALPVLRFIAHDSFLSSNAGAWPPLLGAYEMILRDNPWLLAEFRARMLAPATDAPERNTLVYVLAYITRNDPAFGAALPTEPGEQLKRTQRLHWPDPDQELLSGGQLDVLWGRFFATGSLAPIQRLISALEYVKYQGSIEAFKKLVPKPATASPEVLREVIYRAAAWSLKANATQHRLVHDYLAYEMNQPKTAQNVALQLALIIGAQIKTSDGKTFDPSHPPASGSH